ncbi:cell wall hydrolase [Mesorhizobium sp. KR1-2]|uniref:cell wall hydrolase n=1 Tax=Mesorhizobium sp. KR1-2 TaxID=3156609 RepID=UPI0032B44397
MERVRACLALGTVISACFLAGCTTQGTGGVTDDIKTSSISKISSVKTSYAYSAKDKECLARAMFFESNRSSREGLVAVGTVVMNRLRSGEYGDTVCQVVGQKGQFAPGVLTRKMETDALPDVVAAADSVLKGERHPAVKNAMFFHTAGLRFPYKNMHYVLQAGGNAFYEKRDRHRVLRPGVEAQVAEAAVQNQEGVEPGTAVAMKQAGRTGTGQSVAAATPQMIGGAVVQRVAATTATVEQSAFAYEADPKAASAIGALIATQNRPMPRVE